MNRRNAFSLTLASLLIGILGCADGASEPEMAPDSAENTAAADWLVLVDSTGGLNNFAVVGGQADWAVVDGAIQATTGGDEPSFLVSQNSYEDFELRVEFWASHDANSGVFLRCQDPNSILDTNCYEANIYDQRPDPTYGTGGIVNIAAAPDPMPKAGGKWNTYEIRVDREHIVLVLNGVTTVDIQDSTFSSGPIALQWGSGILKFRKVEIREL